MYDYLNKAGLETLLGLIKGKITGNTPNPNLLINPDFKINQRGVSGTFSETGKYFVDRWRLESGSVTINADGTLTLNGTVVQIFENAVGVNVTASSDSGTASYDNNTKAFSITGNGDVIRWAKLEYGDTATAFIPPDPVMELLKCQRYYCKGTVQTTGGVLHDNLWIVIPVVTFAQPMRRTPTTQVISYSGALGTLSRWDNHADVDIGKGTIILWGVDNTGFTSLNGNFSGMTFLDEYVFLYTADAEIY